MGPQRGIADNRAQWAERLASFTVTLTCSDGVTRTGSGANVLDSPLTALKFLVDEIARYPHARPLEAGEIITTGTLTDAMPIAAGPRWSTQLEGIALDGIAVARFGKPRSARNHAGLKDKSSHSQGFAAAGALPLAHCGHTGCDARGLSWRAKK